MLNGDFFSIVNHTDLGNSAADFTLAMNPNHTIYCAHFPNNPITPGACIIQIAKDLFSFLRQTDYTIKKIKTVKFIHPIIPTVHKTVHFNLQWEESDDLFRVKVAVYEEDIVFSKINMQLEKKDL